MTNEQFMQMVLRGCGYDCPHRDIIGGTCERHGPTAIDRIVEHVTGGFRRDLNSIMRDNRDETR